MEETNDREGLLSEEALDAQPSTKYLIALALFAALLFGAIALVSIWL